VREIFEIIPFSNEHLTFYHLPIANYDLPITIYPYPIKKKFSLKKFQNLKFLK